ELLALRRLPASTFAILMSLEPAIAAMAGFLVLSQALSVTEAAAIALVIAASMGAVRTQVGPLRRSRERAERTPSLLPAGRRGSARSFQPARERAISSGCRARARRRGRRGPRRCCRGPSRARPPRPGSWRCRALRLLIDSSGQRGGNR